MLSFSQFCSDIEEQQYNPMSKDVKPENPRTQQMIDAFKKMQQRQDFYGKNPEDIKGDPSEIGDTWNDYKAHIRVHGNAPMRLPNPKPETGKEIQLDLDKHDPDVTGSRKTKKIMEAEYQGRDVPLNKPMAGDVKKSKVFVKNAEGNVVKVNFGDKNMTIKKNIPARRKSFRARHHCEDPGPKTKARYWSCKAW